MRKFLVSAAAAALVAVPGAAQASESITVGTDDCYAQVDYALTPSVGVDPTRPPFVYFVMCPGTCFGVEGAGLHCPI